MAVKSTFVHPQKDSILSIVDLVFLYDLQYSYVMLNEIMINDKTPRTWMTKTGREMLVPCL